MSSGTWGAGYQGFTSKNPGSCYFRGPPGLATPFYRNFCFEPPFSTTSPEPNSCGCCGQSNDQHSLNCIRSYASRSACQFSGECDQVGNRCMNGQCTSYLSDNPRVLDEIPSENLEAYAQAMGLPPPRMTCKNQTILVRDKYGRKFLACPLTATDYKKTPQLATCLKTIWNCRRFKAAGNEPAYNQCQSFQDCFLYDAVRPDGSIIPISVKLNDECMGCLRSSLCKCAQHAGDCMSFDHMAISRSYPN